MKSIKIDLGFKIRYAIYMKKISFLIVAMLTVMGSNTSFASNNGSSCLPDCNDYVSQDHFQWTNYDDDVHMMAAFSIALTSSMIMEHRFHMNRVESALFGVVIGGLIGTSKEVFFDDYTSKTDIKTWWLGFGIAGTSVILLRF